MNELPLYTVIMAGGRGERFWPLSRPEFPKPFLRLFSDRSLLQQTYDRARELSAAGHVFLIVGKQHEAVSREQLPELASEQLLLEPTGRDTAAAIGYAAMHLPEDAAMLVLPADHLIPDRAAFAGTIRSGLDFLRKQPGDTLVTFGIIPTRPETNYGYIRAGVQAAARPAIYRVERFVEKPDRKKAEEYVRQKSYYWNSGIFLWKVASIRRLIAAHLPELWSGLLQIKQGHDLAGLYGKLPRISIDYGVMEKAGDVAIVPAAFQWDDIGTWNSLTRILPLDNNSNLVRGEHHGVDTTDCIIYAEGHKIATAGISGLIIVQAGDRTLVCTREYADRLKELLAKLPK